MCKHLQTSQARERCKHINGNRCDLIVVERSKLIKTKNSTHCASKSSVSSLVCHDALCDHEQQNHNTHESNNKTKQSTQSQCASTYNCVKLVSDANASTGIAVIWFSLRCLSSSRQKTSHIHIRICASKSSASSLVCHDALCDHERQNRNTHESNNKTKYMKDNYNL
jgi:hypothetical protein